jgi:hypothetical protein
MGSCFSCIVPEYDESLVTIYYDQISMYSTDSSSESEFYNSITIENEKNYKGVSQ